MKKENNSDEPISPAFRVGDVMHCLNCQFIRKMKSGKDWCINDKSWLVGWITDVHKQGCEYHVSVNSA